jgi:K+-transporting ATPase ATPase A chain
MLDTFLIPSLVIGGTALLSMPLGAWLARVMDPAPADSLMTRANGLFTAVAGAAARPGQDWKAYALALMAFNAVAFLFVFAMLMLQQHLPLNPDGAGPLSWDLAFNTTASFVTNTNLQHYSGEQAMSYLSQLAALMWLQFVTPAVGLAVLVAVARGLAGRQDLGNFWLDLQRATFLVLLPLATVWAIALALLGVPMTLQGTATATTLEGAQQLIARGPVAAFVAIKQLGTNGGGFFGPNSAHPLENPGMWTNLLQTIALILVPMACVSLFGRILGRPKHARLIFLVMLGLLATKLSLAMWAESAPTVAFAGLPVTAEANLEGKEMRLGGVASATWAVLTTSTSNGSVNAMMDSLNPLTGLVMLVDMWLNATFGGIGVGLVNMWLYILVAVFLGGMLIGRTPTYIGHRIEAREVRLAILALALHGALILGGTALFAATDWGAGTTSNPGPHGFSQILYEFTSASANNGSGFEGLGDNTPPWNVATGLVMLLARYLPILIPLAIVGLLAAKPRAAETEGTLSPNGATFGGLLVATLLIFGALTFLPAAVLGPIAEQLAQP